MYEVHITVETNDIEKFKADCEELGVKPIVIELQHSKGAYQQVMTSSKYTGDNHESIVKLLRASLHLGFGYDIVRMKVEYHPDFVPDKTKILYYESHLRVLIKNEEEELILDQCCKKCSFHKSRNVFKKLENGDKYIMATFRIRDVPKREFYNLLSPFSYLLNLSNIKCDKVEVEACVLDTNEELDKEWLN